jgi:hypothetical protein
MYSSRSAVMVYVLITLRGDVPPFPILHDLAQLAVDFGFVRPVAAGPDNARTLPGKGLIFLP